MCPRAQAVKKPPSTLGLDLPQFFRIPAPLPIMSPPEMGWGAVLKWGVLVQPFNGATKSALQRLPHSSMVVASQEARGNLPGTGARRWRAMRHLRMNTEIRARLIQNDPALNGFSPADLPEAAKARTWACLYAGSLDRHHSNEELEEIGKWCGDRKSLDASVASFRSGECCYYVFADGSLYFASNADSEVWADASDFAVEKIINGYEGALVEMDADLLNHLGYEEEVTARGLR